MLLPESKSILLQDSSFDRNMDWKIFLCNSFSVFTIIIFQNVFLVVGKNVSEIEICHTQNETASFQLHIKSPSFPEAWSRPIKCQCDIEGSDIAIATRTLILTGHSSNSILKMSYYKDGKQTGWPHSGTEISFDDLNRKIIIDRGASKIRILMDTLSSGSSQNMLSLFMFDFQASSDIFVSCTDVSSSNKTTDEDDGDGGGDEKTDKSLLEEIGSVCSPQFVIILGAVCCSLLLIILIISIVLCRIVPKKKQGYTIDNRNQQVTVEKNLPKAEKAGRESLIYDDAEIRLTGPSEAYNNATYQQEFQNYTNANSYSNTDNNSGVQRSFTMPQAFNRQSAQYVNTSAMSKRTIVNE